MELTSLHVCVHSLYLSMVGCGQRRCRGGRRRGWTAQQQVQVLKLREDLEDEAVRSLHIPHSKFLEMAKARWAWWRREGFGFGRCGNLTRCGSKAPCPGFRALT